MKSIIKLTLNLYLMLTPLVLFLLFIKPFFLARYFESSILQINLFKAIISIGSIIGLFGLLLYLIQIIKAIKSNLVKQPNIWLKLPVAILSLTIIVIFFIPLIGI